MIVSALKATRAQKRGSDVVPHKMFTTDKAFIYHRLMKSVRTPRGPRHRKILNLGKLLLAKEDWKTLANRIEEIIRRR